MESTFTPEVIEEAHSSATRACHDVGVEVRNLAEAEDMERVESLFQEVWAAEGKPQVTAHLLRALATDGGYVAGAFRDSRLVGASMAFIGGGATAPHLHSHISGVVAGLQAKGVGYALKVYQRWWALKSGFGLVTWTFDPLVRRNAYFNLAKLGADIVRFDENFYGAMTDGINSGDLSDRCHIEWDLASTRVRDILTKRAQPEGVDEGKVVLASGSAGEPITREPEGMTLSAFIPEDIGVLRSQDPKLALEWRYALRATLGSALAMGYSVKTMTRAGSYILRRNA